MDPQQGTPAQDVIIGQTIGNYLVTQKLGEGGMGSVYLAEHPSIGKKVALKVLHSEFSSNEDVVTRFFNEAKAVNNIGHPNIVDITDYGVIEGIGKEHLVYFIMEYLGGITLSKLIRNEAPLPPERALGISLQVADALAASHRCGIVHRDLKPDNIMLTKRGREADFVKLLDFGIAKLTGGAAGSRKTRTGIVMGTPAYMSPEQCDGRGNIDHRTDVYALGICIYEMLVGRVPFLGEGYGEVLVQHLTQPPTPPSQFRLINPHVEAVVMKALQKPVELRYPTMDEMIRALTDPVAFVEQHGGVATFTQVQLMPSSAPMPEIRHTPAPLTGPITTPQPGTLTPPHHQQPHIPTPGTGLNPIAGMHQAYGNPTLAASGATGAMPAEQPGKSKVGFVIAGLVVAAIAIVAIVLATRGGGDKETEDPTTPSGSDTGSMVAKDPGSGSDPGSAKDPGNDPGSAKDPGSASNPGSAAGSNVAEGSDAGSATVPSVVTVKIITTPVAGTILVNGQPLAQKTGEEFTLRRGSTDVTITLKPVDSRYEEIKFTVKPEQNIESDKVFVKKRSSGTYRPPTGSGTPTSGSGKGSSTPGKGSATTGKGSGSGKKLGDDIVRPGD